MSLLRAPPSRLTDISQILDFAQGNRKALEQSKIYSREELLQKYSVDEFLEIVKYRKFFRNMEYVAKVVGEGNVCAEDYLRDLDNELMAIIGETDSIQGKIANEDVLHLCDYFIDHYDCLKRMVRFMDYEIRKNRLETGKTNGEMVVDEIAQEASNNEMETSNNRNATEDVGLHGLGEDHRYGAALNEEEKKTGGDGMEEGWNMPQTLPTAPVQSSTDNGTKNVANDPVHQLSENEKLNFAGGVTPREDLRESIDSLLTQTQMKNTLEEINRRYPNSNTNNITLETLNNIRKGGNSSEAHFGDGHEEQEGRNRATVATINSSDPGAFRPSDSQRSKGGVSLTEGIQLRTLEDSLKHFGFSERLEDLEKSLEEMRRGQKTEEAHQDECKKLDKELQQLSRTCHPDSVMREGGSEKEVARAKEMQTALNATRTVLKTLSRIFVEDKDIDHRYAFFTRLQLGLLGNEDQVEDHVYQVLFKISLVSEIKQTIIIFEIRNILANGPRCIARYLENDVSAFTSFRDIVVFHLGRCVAGYKKLHTELQEVVSECEEERLQNILPALKEMKSDCRRQLSHFENLLELSKRSFGVIFPRYSSLLPVDEYYVLPVISYLNVIFACSAMIGTSANNNAVYSRIQSSATSFFSWFSNPFTNDEDWYGNYGDPNTGSSKFEYAMTGSQSGYTSGDRQSGCTTGDRQSGYTTGDRQSGYTTGNRQSGCTTGNRQSGCTTGDRQSGYTTGIRQSGYTTGNRQSGYTTGDRQSGCTTGDRQSKRPTSKRQFTVDFKDTREVDSDIEEGDEIARKIKRLYELALAYRGDKRCKAKIKKKYDWKSMDKSFVQSLFSELLGELQAYLESKFNIENYVEGNTNRHILKACKEMMAEFREKSSKVVRGIEELNKQNEIGRQQLEQVEKNNQVLDNQIRQCRENNKMFFNQILELQTKRSQNSRINLQ